MVSGEESPVSDCFWLLAVPVLQLQLRELLLVLVLRLLQVRDHLVNELHFSPVKFLQLFVLLHRAAPSLDSDLFRSLVLVHLDALYARVVSCRYVPLVALRSDSPSAIFTKHLFGTRRYSTTKRLLPFLFSSSSFFHVDSSQLNFA